MIIVEKIDGAWAPWTGRAERTASTCTVTYQDGRVEEQACAPYPVAAQLDMARVRGLIADGTWTGEDLAPYGLRLATPFAVPEGERVDGSPAYVEDGDDILEVYATTDVPPPSLADYPLKRWQFKAMVEVLGVAAAITAAINAMTDPMARAVTMARYLDSDIYRREDPLFDQLAPAVGLTPEEIDAAWWQIATGL